MWQVAVTDLCQEGPIQAVEIQVESPSLANMCRTHHAVITRMQVRQPLMSLPQRYPAGDGDRTVGVCGCLWGVAGHSLCLSASTCTCAAAYPPGSAQAEWSRLPHHLPQAPEGSALA